MTFESRIQQEVFYLAEEYEKLTRISKRIGAIVSFTGQVRDTALELEHYPAMAERQMASILAQARARWPLQGAIIVHRHGRLEVGAPIVLVLTASEHRAEAFAAAEFLMDWLKTRAPFWKKAPEGWVNAKTSDDDSAERWDRK